MSRGRIWPLALILAIAAVGVTGFYFWRDLNLPLNTVFEKLPEVVVENLNFQRDIDGRTWQVVARSAEHEEGVVRALSIDLSISDDKTSRRTEIKAVSGDFAQATSDVTLHVIDGTLFLPESSVDMTAPLAQYNSTESSWRFSEGFEMWDEDTRLTGDDAIVTSEGLFIVERGARILWSIK